MLKETFYKPLCCMAALFLVACEPTQHTVKIGGETMGTFWQVSIAGEKLDTKSLYTNINQRLEAINQSMSTYLEDSELSRLNRNPSTQGIELSPELEKVIARGLEISALSDGFYDITVQPLVQLRGFGADREAHRPPDAQAIAEVLPYIGYELLRLEGGKLYKSDPRVQIDLSSIAKGYAVDQLAEFLQAQGYEHFLVDIGGELRSSGDKFGEAWQVAIEEPDETRRNVHKLLSLRGAHAMATSGNYRNFIDENGQRVVHTLNPKTGEAIASSLVSASVLAQDCMSADAYATALMALGEVGAQAFVEQNHLAAYLIFTDGDRYRVLSSEAFERAIHSEEK